MCILTFLIFSIIFRFFRKYPISLPVPKHRKAASSHWKSQKNYFVLTKPLLCDTIFRLNRGVAQVVERLVRDQEAAGSSPVTPTISSIHKGFDFMNTRFFIFIFFSSFIRLIRYVPSKVCALLFFVMLTAVSGDILPIRLFLCLLCNARKMQFQAVQHILQNDNR